MTHREELQSWPFGGGKPDSVTAKSWLRLGTYSPLDKHGDIVFVVLTNIHLPNHW